MRGRRKAPLIRHGQICGKGAITQTDPVTSITGLVASKSVRGGQVLKISSPIWEKSPRD